jgi:uncharacterized protein YaeQ
MALKATIFKADLNVADLGRHYYGQHALVLARHPSETDERMMVRLLAFALHADPLLAFGKGLSTDDEPDLWLRDLTGAIKLWIDVGRPDERRVRKACGRAEQVIVYSYGGSSAGIWWDGVRGKLDRADNLTVIDIALATTQALAKLAQRTMELQCTIDDGHAWLADHDARVEAAMTVVKAAASRG